jgi:hypothetical protein
MQRQPIRIACAGDVARDVEQILGRESETGKRPPGTPCNRAVEWAQNAFKGSRRGVFTVGFVYCGV